MDKPLITSAAIKLIENAPAIIVLMIVAYHQQQQINLLIGQCIQGAVFQAQ